MHKQKMTKRVVMAIGFLMSQASSICIAQEQQRFPMSFQLSEPVEKRLLVEEVVPVRIKEFKAPNSVHYKDLTEQYLRRIDGAENPIDAYRFYLAALLEGDRELYRKFLSKKVIESDRAKSAEDFDRLRQETARWLDALTLRITHQFSVQDISYIRVQSYGSDNGKEGESIRFLQSMGISDGYWVNSNLAREPLTRALIENFVAPVDLQNITSAGVVSGTLITFESPSVRRNDYSLIEYKGDK